MSDRIGVSSEEKSQHILSAFIFIYYRYRFEAKDDL